MYCQMTYILSAAYSVKSLHVERMFSHLLNKTSCVSSETFGLKFPLYGLRYKLTEFNSRALDWETFPDNSCSLRRPLGFGFVCLWLICFYVYECFACIYVCIPLACLLPTDWSCRWLSLNPGTLEDRSVLKDILSINCFPLLYPFTTFAYKS